MSKEKLFNNAKDMVDYLKNKANKGEMLIFDEAGTWNINDVEYSDETKEMIKRIIKHEEYS